MSEDEIASRVVNACLAIHKKTGPGLFESVYEAILSYELAKSGLAVDRQVPLPVVWEELVVHQAFRADLIVEHNLFVELKSIEHVLPAHKKQLLTYLRVSRLRLGLLVNFGEELMKSGITRVINSAASFSQLRGPFSLCVSSPLSAMA